MQKYKGSIKIGFVKKERWMRPPYVRCFFLLLSSVISSELSSSLISSVEQQADGEVSAESGSALHLPSQYL